MIVWGLRTLNTEQSMEYREYGRDLIVCHINGLHSKCMLYASWNSFDLRQIFVHIVLDAIREIRNFEPFMSVSCSSHSRPFSPSFCSTIVLPFMGTGKLLIACICGYAHTHTLSWYVTKYENHIVTINCLTLTQIDLFAYAAVSYLQWLIQVLLHYHLWWAFHFSQATDSLGKNPVRANFFSWNLEFIL